jgi:hypothetical protein
VVPQPGNPAFAAAVEDYRFSLMAGNSMSGRQLCRDHGVNPDNRGWVFIAEEQKPVKVEETPDANRVSGSLF